MTVPALGHQCKFHIGVGGTNTAMTGWCTLALHETHLEREGTRGTRSHDVDDVAAGPSICTGQIILNPTNTELCVLDVLAIGASGVVAETMTEFNVVVDKNVNTYTYANCVCDVFTLRGRAGGLIEVVMDVVAKAETDAGTVAEPAAALPMGVAGTTLILAAAGKEVESFEMRIDNQIIKDRFQHEATLTDFSSADRIVTLTTEHSYSSNTSGLYDQALAGATGSLAVTDGTSTRTYTFGKLQVPADGPEIRSKGPVPLVLNMTARKDGSTKEIAAA